MVYRFKIAQKKRARVHFIPDMKVGVFVTLRAPDVIITISFRLGFGGFGTLQIIYGDIQYNMELLSKEFIFIKGKLIPMLHS